MVRPHGDADIEQAIKVVWDQDRVVIRPIGILDRDSIDAVLGLLACAREAGVRAGVDLDSIVLDDLAGSELVGRLMADASVISSNPF